MRGPAGSDGDMTGGQPALVPMSGRHGSAPAFCDGGAGLVIAPVAAAVS
jgi:hypothetical protein